MSECCQITHNKHFINARNLLTFYVNLFFSFPPFHQKDFFSIYFFHQFENGMRNRTVEMICVELRNTCVNNLLNSLFSDIEFKKTYGISRMIEKPNHISELSKFRAKKSWAGRT